VPPITNRGRRYARFNPLNPTDLALFLAALAGEHATRGFRDTDIIAASTGGHQSTATKPTDDANASHD
jgi:hypothetical protein